MRAAIVLALLAACGANLTPQPMPVPALPNCTPNLDGVIDASELPIALGAALDYYASPAGATRAIDPVPQGGVWDMSTQLPDDVVIALGPIALHDQWYASSFPSSQFVVDAGGGLDGVFHQDGEALWLDGTASHDQMPAAGQTLIVYGEPVATLRFPITDGDSYTEVAELPAATIDGLPFIGTDTFEIDVADSGRLDVPYVDFSPVLRVRTHLTRKPSAGAPVVGTRATGFTSRCFGEIAHAESQPNETNPDFTTAASLRRFALGEQP